MARRVGAVVATVAVVGGVALACAGSAGADNGDSFPPGPEVTTNFLVTGHDTTFDDIAPALDENAPPPDGYVPGGDEPCPAGGVIPGSDFAQWDLVGNVDTPVTLEGQVTSSKLAWDDNPLDHHSRDRNFFVVPDNDPSDPAHNFAALLAAPGNFHQGEPNEAGRIEVEWESAAFPAWALPMMGDRVHVEGSHIWDCAHGEQGFRTEIHPPRLVMTLRDAADQWSNGAATIPARPGWADKMPGMGSLPIRVTRADVFASSDGGEARGQETCFLQSCPISDWYQPLKSKDYDLFIPAPPKPTADAQLITKVIHRPFPTCNSGDGGEVPCGSVDVYGAGPDPDPNRFTFTEEAGGPTGTQVHVHVNFTGFTEPPTHLYGFGFTLEVGWNQRGPFDTPSRVKVTIENVHVANTLDIGADNDGEFEISSLIGDTFRHMLLTGNGLTESDYNYIQDVPETTEVNLGDYGIRSDSTPGSKCALQALGGADPGPCQTSFEVSLLPGQPLRVFFRAEERDPENANDEAGTVERIATEAQNYGIGEHTEWFQERTSAGADALDESCGLPNPLPCLSITYKIEDDPFPVPPQTTVSPGSPVVVQGEDTWVTPATPIGLTASAPNGHPGDLIEIHARFWRSNTQPPPESICGSGTGAATCTLHLNTSDGLDGHYTVEYSAVDATTGAVEATQSTEFRLDNTAPATAAFLAGTFLRGWYRTPVTVTLFATDGAGVGVGSTSYIVDGGPTTPYLAPFLVSGDSPAHVVSFASADKLGNTEPLQSAQFQLDGTPPTLAVSDAFDGAFHYTQNELVSGVFTNASSLTVAYTASDALSGLYQVRLDGTPIASSPATVTLNAGISTHSLVVEDVAGNLTTLTFSVVSVQPVAGGASPQGSGFWKSYAGADLSGLLAEVDIVSRAFGTPDNRYADATLANYQTYLSPGANPTVDDKVRRELLAAWLNLVSGREAAGQQIDLKSVSAWPTVVTNTAGSSITTALNLVRESERRLEQNPSSTLLNTIETLLEKLNTGKLNQ